MQLHAHVYLYLFNVAAFQNVRIHLPMAPYLDLVFIKPWKPHSLDWFKEKNAGKAETPFNMIVDLW